MLVIVVRMRMLINYPIPVLVIRMLIDSQDDDDCDED
jgi:hypothetical protein